jgi:DNA-binding NarL/FixJ family response regulator
MIRVMLADDHVLMREGLKQLFSMASDIEVVSEATTGGAVLDNLRDGSFDLLLLDMTMPGICGEDLISRIRSRDSGVPILVLSMHNELQIARRALKAGANGYVTKDQNPEVLMAAIRKVATGGRFIDPGIAEQMAYEMATDAPTGGRQDNLTDREFQILRLLAKGESVNGIADRLAISNKTVSTHKARLMEKMGFSSNAELVRYALEKGLLD